MANPYTLEEPSYLDEAKQWMSIIYDTAKMTLQEFVRYHRTLTPSQFKMVLAARTIDAVSLYLKYGIGDDDPAYGAAAYEQYIIKQLAKPRVMSQFAGTEISRKSTSKKRNRKSTSKKRNRKSPKK